MVALFCAAMRRDVWEKVGELDERFEVGMFEDDDYCRRARKAGFEIRCLRDCFVHHWHQASFRLLGDEEYQRVYESNRRRFQEKWSGGGPGQRSGAEGNG
jgi:GT2 family glycosyltransferase